MKELRCPSNLQPTKQLPSNISYLNAKVILQITNYQHQDLKPIYTNEPYNATDNGSGGHAAQRVPVQSPPEPCQIPEHASDGYTTQRVPDVTMVAAEERPTTAEDRVGVKLDNEELWGAYYPTTLLAAELIQQMVK